MALNDESACPHKLYLRDLGYLLRELAVEAKQKATASQSEFATGYMAGFHRVVSLMQQQAEAFEIPLEDLELDGFDPDSELV